MYWWLAQHLTVTLAMAAAAWFVCLSPRVGPATRHALWVLVLAKLMTPPLLHWPWHMPTVNDLQGLLARPSNTAKSPNATRPADFVPAEEATIPVVEAPGFSTPIASQEQPLGAQHLEVQPIGQLLPQMTLTAWLVGSGLFAACQALIIGRMARHVRRSEAPTKRLAAAVAFQSQRLGLKPVPVGKVASIVTPMIWAVWRPRLLWPRGLSEDLPGDCLNGLVVHELAHVKRRDHWVAWLELWAAACWWWCPLFWFVRRQLRENAELASDACVVALLPKARREYADALLTVCETASRRTPLLPAVGVSKGSRLAFERRLTMIMRETSSFRLSRGGLLGMLLVFAASMPAWSQSEPVVGDRPASVVAEPAITIEAAAGLTDLFLFEERQLTAEVRPAMKGKSDLTLRGPWQTGTNELAAHVSTADAETVLLDFQADWCGPCKAVEPAIDRLAKLGYPVRKVDIDREKELATRFHVDSIPCLVLRVQGREAHRQVGVASFDELQFLLAKHGVSAGKTGEPEAASADLPPDVREAFDGFQRQEEEARRELETRLAERKAQLLQQLQQMQDKYTREAKLDEALAVRELIRKLQPDRARAIQVRSRSIGAPSSMMSYRQRVGETFTFQLTGAASGTVWGSDIYTDDSSLAAAAVHAGVLRNGQTGTVRVTMLEGSSCYQASDRNGVSSLTYADWPASYRFETNFNAPAATLSLSEKIRRSPEFKTIELEITGSSSGAVWGTDVYTDDSSVPAAAVHAGLLEPGQTGKLRITFLPGRSSYSGATRHGVTSSDWKSWNGSLRLEKSTGPVFVAPVPEHFDYLRSEPASESAHEAATGFNSLLSGAVESSLLGDAKIGQSVELEVTGSTTGTVWGSDIYTADSSLPAAAVHAGLLKPGEKARIRVTFAEGLPSYEGVERNGVQSYSWRSWDRSYKLEKCDAANEKIGLER